MINNAIIESFFSQPNPYMLIHSKCHFSMPYTETFEIALYHHLSFLMATTKCNIFLYCITLSDLFY